MGQEIQADGTDRLSRNVGERLPLNTEQYHRTVQISGPKYEGWNFNSGNYLFTTDTK